MMEQRKFIGDPIDITWNPGPWATGEDDDEDDDETMSTESNADGEDEQNGETIAGTSPDDFGDEETVTLPETADTENMPPAEREIVETAVLMQNATQSQIAERVGRHPSTVSRSLSKHYPHHPSRGNTNPSGMTVHERNGATCQECGESFETRAALGGHLGGAYTGCPNADDSDGYTTESERGETVADPDGRTGGQTDEIVDAALVMIHSLHRQAKREVELGGSSEAVARQATLEEVITILTAAGLDAGGNE